MDGEHRVNSAEDSAADAARKSRQGGTRVGVGRSRLKRWRYASAPLIDSETPPTQIQEKEDQEFTPIGNVSFFHPVHIFPKPL